MATHASDGSSDNVQALHDSIPEGDTITIPAGTFTWTTGVNFTKNITLEGAGIGVTILLDNVTGDQLIHWVLAPAGLGRITGIEFQHGGRSSVGTAPGGIIRIEGSNTNDGYFRFDHNKWIDLFGYLVVETALGVVDHNTIITGLRATEWIYIYGSNWNGLKNGDGAWTEAANWGSSQFLFIEDNTFHNVNAVFEGQLCDGFNGSRYVVRYNTIINFATGNHGTETGGRGRSGRAQEIYNNTYDLENVNRFVANARGGGLLFHHNTITGVLGGAINANAPTIGAFRMLGEFAPWGGSDGTNQWDQNNPGNPFYSGTLTGATGQTVTIASAAWTTNMWTGYTIKRAFGGFSYIDSNTNDTLTFRTDIFGGQPAYAIGDAIAINKVDQALDQAGVGQGSEISGSPPVPIDTTFNQVVEPCYSWANLNDGTDFNSFDPHTHICQSGVHYFNNTAAPGYAPYLYPHPLQTGITGGGGGDAVVISGAPIF